jgi:c-di-GMP-binding flagellar brake protein YcgR
MKRKTAVENENPGNDKRRLRRVRVSISVIYRVHEPLTIRLLTSDREIRANMLDLTEEGLAILTDYDLPVSTIILIRFTLFRVDDDDVSLYGPVEIAGEVRYNANEGGEHRLGIRFTGISDEDKRQIGKFTARSLEKLDNGKRT